MQKATLLILSSLVLASLAGYLVFTNTRIQNEKYHEYLARLADEVNAANTSWKAGVNQKFANADFEGVKAHCGTLLDNGHGLNFETVSDVAANIPISFDARTQWGSACPSLLEIRDQSNCGSCWAFGAAEALSDRHCIVFGQDIRLSTENLLSCCAACGNGCQGGYPHSAMDYYVHTGLVTGDLFGTTSWCQAYTFPPCAHHVTSDVYPACSGESQTPKCIKSCDANSTYGKTYAQDIHKGSKAYNVSTHQEAIKTEIMAHGPIEASFTVYEDFVNYKSGVYVHTTGKRLGGHAVKMIGWGTENNIPYWIIVNSWNNTWGDQGTFKIRRGVNECGIEGGLVAAIPAN